jgi:hypothetical protein
VDGSARADTGEYGLTFEISVEPPTPRVGDLVRIRISVDGEGGRPVYQLRNTWPFFDGDVRMISAAFFHPVEYELRAVCPGTATLQTSVSYEVNAGCPGSELHHRTGDGESFEIEILGRPCPGDCNEDGVVGIDEVVAAIQAAVEDNPARCGVDANSDGRVDINELVLVVRSALTGCFGDAIQAP